MHWAILVFSLSALDCKSTNRLTVIPGRAFFTLLAPSPSSKNIFTFYPFKLAKRAYFCSSSIWFFVANFSFLIINAHPPRRGLCRDCVSVCPIGWPIRLHAIWMVLAIVCVYSYNQMGEFTVDFLPCFNSQATYFFFINCDVCNCYINAHECVLCSV